MKIRWSAFRKKRKLLAFASVLGLLVFFQNCGGKLSTQELSSEKTSTGPQASNTGGNTPGNTQTPETPAGSPTPTDGAPSNPPTPEEMGPSPAEIAAKRLAACKALLGQPKITNQVPGSSTVSSGAGVSAGDAAAERFELDVDRGVTDEKLATEQLCGFQTNVSCMVITNDSNYPFELKAAVNSGGNPVVGTELADTDQEKTQILSLAFNRNNNACNGAVNLDTNKKTIQLNIRRNSANDRETYRCVEGSVWMKISVRTQIDQNNQSPESNIIYHKVNLKNTCWGENRLKQEPWTLAQLSGFGRSVAMTSEWAAVLTDKENVSDVLTSVGSVYMFKKISGVWRFQQKLVLPNPVSNDGLTSVVIEGSRLVMSSRLKSSGSGVVAHYALSNGSWGFVELLNSPQAGSAFGASLALNNNYLAVGAPHYLGSKGVRQGLVQIFNCATGSCLPSHQIEGEDVLSYFGAALAMDSQKLLVGATQEDMSTPGPGYAELFEVSTGRSLKKVTALDPQDGMRFGASVALSGLSLAVGAPQYNTPGALNVGRVQYIQDFNQAGQGRVLDLGNGASGSDYFGEALSFSTQGLFVGCTGCVVQTLKSGSVRYYLMENLNKPATVPLTFNLTSLNATAADRFGSSLQAVGASVVVGAKTKSDPNRNSGAAFVVDMK